MYGGSAGAGGSDGGSGGSDGGSEGRPLSQQPVQSQPSLALSAHVFDARKKSQVCDLHGASQGDDDSSGANVGSSAASNCLPGAERVLPAQAASFAQVSDRNEAMADDASVTRIRAVALTLAAST